MTSRDDGSSMRKPAAWSSVIDPLVDPIVDFSDDFVTRARDAVRTADDYVHDNPWAAVGVFGLIGLAAGYFLSRRF